ncbi:hypothetical protein BWI15_23240 [Kribbella sp. ALI-6-A]|uniref:hypothetical protein n=1 Tax=Kribbella sp. ALI-6-A TaxID=1933817 RepID=UPI00097BFF83|nr:hypothetical protein [Kribbella sp. ALI-6-A]ONI69495.1 hypothetical protein BWI15_23240 [Kribbella sp. ALI-6-A]
MTVPPQGSAPMHVPAFSMKQRITMMANKYELIATNPDGSDGPLLAFAQQKRMAFKEEVTFYTDDRKAEVVFSFKARKRLDLGAGYDVFDASGQAIGWFKKEFGKSLLRSSWQLTGPGFESDGTERNPTIAIVRRVWEFVPFVGDIPLPFIFHFDFTDRTSGQPVLSVERKVSVRDRYRVTVHDSRVDFRVAAAMTVALDALQSR